MTRISRLLLAAAAGVSLCLGSVHGQERNKPFKVVTTFTILADMAQNVAGDNAVVVSITKPGAEIHGYEPQFGLRIFREDALARAETDSRARAKSSVTVSSVMRFLE